MQRGRGDCVPSTHPSILGGVKSVKFAALGTVIILVKSIMDGYVGDATAAIAAKSCIVVKESRQLKGT